MPINYASASSQYSDLGTALSAIQNLTGATIMGWANITSFANAEGFGLMYSTGTSNTSARLSFSFRSVGSLIRTTARRLDADAADIVDTTGAQSTGVPIHISATAAYNGASHGLYINGALNNSSSPAGWTGSSSNTASNDGAIGSRGDHGTATFFNGVLWDIRVYNRVLSLAEINTIYRLKGADTIFSGMINRWKQQEGQSGAVASGAGSVKDWCGVNNATPTNSPTYTGGFIKKRRAA